MIMNTLSKKQQNRKLAKHTEKKKEYTLVVA